MGAITLSIPDELLLALQRTPEQCGHALRLTQHELAQETPLAGGHL